MVADGTSVEADVVIGADGVHSVVRDAVTGFSSARYSGICAFRTLAPTTDPWSATATVEEFLAEFARWDPRLRDLIEQAATTCPTGRSSRPGTRTLAAADPLVASGRIYAYDPGRGGCRCRSLI